MEVDLVTAAKRTVQSGYYTCFMSIDELLRYFEACKTGEIYVPLCND